MRRAGTAAVALAVLALAAGCRDTPWPSDADPSAFCGGFTSPRFTESGIDENLRELGTPPNLPFEARRYLLQLDEDDHPAAADRAVFEKYLSENC